MNLYDEEYGFVVRYSEGDFAELSVWSLCTLKAETYFTTKTRNTFCSLA